MTTPAPAAQRCVVAWASVSIDGYTSGPDGPEHDTWLYRHATLETTSTYFEGIWRGANTALLGRNNYEGFASVWPGIIADPASDARARDVGTWLASVEKVVFSRTLTEASWTNSRIARDLEAEVRALKSAEGRDILVLCSASIIGELLGLDLVDDLRFEVLPVLLGGGLRLLPEGTGQLDWQLMDSTTMGNGAVGLHYRRVRTDPQTDTDTDDSEGV